ncbi:MAG: tetratricopeptide repeat protein [bacterium]
MQKSGAQTQISFEDKLGFYLNQKSKNFLVEMTNNEKLLLQQINNITREIKARGKRAFLKDEIGYTKIFGKSEKLVAEYSRELKKVLQLYDEIQQLEKVVVQVNDLDSWDKLADLRYQLMGVLENREIFKKGTHSQAVVSQMFKDYFKEIDSVLLLNKRLDRLERYAKEQGDEHLLQEVQMQRNQISYLLSENQITASEDTLTDQYITENKLVVNVLKQLDALQAQALNDNSEVSLEIEKLKRSLLSQLDDRVLALLGYDSNVAPDRSTVTEIFDTWKAGQIADYKVRFTQYEIMKANLLNHSSNAERARMLERDLKDAFSSYIDANYSLAEMQFNEILKDYRDYFANMESVLFYRGETYFARQLYEKALTDYDQIVTEYPNSPYLSDALARLLLINEEMGNTTDFYRYFAMVQANSANITQTCSDQCNYLAGYVYFKNANFESSKLSLSHVSRDSKLYLMAQYLLGIVYANENNYTEAKRIFEALTNLDNYPWTDAQTTFVRNNALLKLGYLSYEQGEYEKARNYFGSVSPGFSHYDKSLLGAAWTNLKEGRYGDTVQDVNKLFHNYLASNSTYEALVLSAHCKRLLKENDAALKNLRYVANARSVFELSKQYNDERKKILDQLAKIDQIEDKVLDRRDESLYSVTSKIREQIQKMLLQFRYRGGTGSLMLEDLRDERKVIFKQIDELNKIIAQAEANGNSKVANDANYQRERLIKTLDTYQSDLSIRNINYFLDYPLATKESMTNYRKDILSEMMPELEKERQRITSTLAQIQNLRKNKRLTQHNLDAKLDLEILEKDLSDLRNHSSQFRAWLLANKVEDVNTKFDQWADFSGFGMSDITFQSIEERDKEISAMAQNIESVNQLLQHRKEALARKLSDFDAEVEKIEKELKKEQIEIEKREREKYFKDLYFDTQEGEVKGADQPDSSLY